MTIEGAAPSLSMWQMSICVHVSLGVPGNGAQLFTNEENWTRNDMDMPWLWMLPPFHASNASTYRDPWPHSWSKRLPSPGAICYIFFSSYMQLYITWHTAIGTSRAHGPFHGSPRDLLFRSSDLSQDAGATLLLRQLCCCLGRSVSLQKSPHHMRMVVVIYVFTYWHIGANLHPNVRILWNIQPWTKVGNNIDYHDTRLRLNQRLPPW